LRTHGNGGASAIPSKIFGSPINQAGKKKRGSGGNEFLPACQSASGGQELKSVSAILRQQKVKTEKFSFKSLIEKNCEWAIKKSLENFSVLLAEAKQRRAETPGGN